MLEKPMRSILGVRLAALLGVSSLLPSCCLVTVPVETAGTVVTSTVRVAEKTAITTVDVAGKAAGAVIDGVTDDKAGGNKAGLWGQLRQGWPSGPSGG
jgi:hypothetical protein